MEEAIYESYAMSDSLGADFIDGQAQGAAASLKSRHLLEKHRAAAKFLQKRIIAPRA